MVMVLLFTCATNPTTAVRWRHYCKPQPCHVSKPWINNRNTNELSTTIQILHRKDISQGSRCLIIILDLCGFAKFSSYLALLVLRTHVECKLRLLTWLICRFDVVAHVAPRSTEHRSFGSPLRVNYCAMLTWIKISWPPFKGIILAK